MPLPKGNDRAYRPPPGTRVKKARPENWAPEMTIHVFLLPSLSFLIPFCA